MRRKSAVAGDRRQLKIEIERPNRAATVKRRAPEIDLAKRRAANFCTIVTCVQFCTKFPAMVDTWIHPQKIAAKSFSEKGFRLSHRRNRGIRSLLDRLE
jgi:hypothetical protein